MGVKDGGVRDRRHVSGQRRADVVAKVRALEGRRDAGIAQAAGRGMTVGQWLEHRLDNIAVRNDECGKSAAKCPKRKGGPELAPSSVLRAHRILSRSVKVAMQRGKVARNVWVLSTHPAPAAVARRRAAR